MVIHWSMTYNRHCRGIYSSLSAALWWWVLQPLAGLGTLLGTSSSRSAILSFFLCPQRPAAKPALPATEICPGFASNWLLTVCHNTLVSFFTCALGAHLVFGQMRQWVETEGGTGICSSRYCCYGLQRWVSLWRGRKQEYLSSASVANKWVAHGGALPDASIFFCPHRCWGCSVTLLKKEGKNWLPGNSHCRCDCDPRDATHQAEGHVCIP